MVVLIFALTAGSVSALTWGLGAMVHAERWTVGLRIARLAAAAGPDLDALRPASAPFSRRLVAPALAAAAAAVRRLLPRDAIRRVEARLTLAGHPWRIAAVDFIGVQVLLGLAMGVIGVWLTLAARAHGAQAALLGGAFAGLGAYLPWFVLSSRIAARRRLALEALPDAVDLLVVCVEAGLGFDAALLKLVEKTQGPLTEEVAAAFAEMRVGRPRREALQGLAARLGVPEVQAFVNAILQSDRLGVPVADVLRAQAQFLRQVRKQRVEEASMRVPVKMIFPLVFFILPSLMVVIIGPAAIGAWRSLAGAHVP